MAGRGRGRGASKVSFAVENLGFARGEALPTAVSQPPPLFPPLEFKPCPLVDVEGSSEDYIYQLGREYKNSMQESAFFLRPKEQKKDVERYSDKYQLSGPEWEPNWSLFPAELRPPKEKRKSKKTAAKPSLSAARKKSAAATLNTLDALEAKETAESEGKEKAEEGSEDEETKAKKKEAAEEQEEEEEAYGEEEMEEENDYIQSYFDNGEGDGDEDDNLDEGAVY